jgi:hypothetical protein
MRLLAVEVGLLNPMYAWPDNPRGLGQHGAVSVVASQFANRGASL